MSRPVSNPLATHIPSEIRHLLDQAPTRHVRNQVLGFVGFLCREGRPLSAATQADLLAYGAEIVVIGAARPKQALRDAARAWNKMTTVPGWPSFHLAPPASSRILMRYEDLPPELKADCDRYLASRAELSEEDLFSRSNQKTWASATLKDRRGKLCQLVALYVEADGKLADLRSLRDLAEEPVCRKILRHLDLKRGNRKSAHFANLAHFLRIIAKYDCDAPQKVIDLITNAQAKFRPGKSGMTPKNKARLRAVLEDAALPRLLKLPTLFVETLGTKPPTLSDALELQSALAIQIELVAPMRAKNLAALDIDAHFDFVSDTQCHIFIEGDDVKNDQDLNYVLCESFIRLFRLYVDVYRPLLLKDKTSSALFISRTGRTKTPAELGDQLPKFIKAQTGLRMNVHLFRHLTGYIYLLHYPGQYEPVRQLLGHKDIRTTINFYVGLEEDAAFKRYGAILERLIAEDEAGAAANV